MNNYRPILKRAGLVLIVVGLLDIGLMIYCIYNRIGYSSSFNIFAVVAGLLLYRGSLGAARAVAWMSAFMLTAFAGLVVAALPFFFGAIDLLATEIHLFPFSFLGAALVGPAMIAFLIWIYKQMRSAPVLQARLAAGLSTSPPRLAFAIPALGMAVVAIALFFLMPSADMRTKAIELARQQIGDGYKYALTGMRSSGNRVWIEVTAYNDREIKPIEVELPR